MALAVLAAGGLRAVLPPALRNGDTRWAFVAVVVVLLGILVIGDPGRIDRDSTWLRIMTGTLIGLISAVNAAAAVRLVAGIIGAVKFSTDAKLATAGSYLALVLFCLLATSSFLYLELYATFAPARAGARLDQLRAWLGSHQDQVLIAVFLLLGFWLAGKSIYLLVN